MTTTSPDDGSTLSASLDALISSSGASWKPVKEIGDTRVHTLASIPYGQESPQHQSLDLFFPDELMINNGEKDCPSSRPVYIHIHGGGWSRGSKDSRFYGGPAMSEHAAAYSGCIAVAPGYRLGKYPEFCHDVAAAIQWVRENIASLGGDLSNVFLSGHSAGGHIASLLVLRHSDFLPFLPRNFFRGLILVSGVYDLFSPMRKAPLDSKNKWFVVAYVMPAFGTDEKLRREASPLLLLDPTKDTSTLGTAARMISSRLLGGQTSGTELKSDSNDTEQSSSNVSEEHATPDTDINTTDLPSTLILNASIDMGLQENGELMAAAMEKHTSVKYMVIPGTDHASICWNTETAKEVKEFINAQQV